MTPNDGGPAFSSPRAQTCVYRAVARHPHMNVDEKEAILSALAAAEKFGHGNIMAWIATNWAVKLRDEEGMKPKHAIEAVSNRGPYPLPVMLAERGRVKP